MIDDPGIDDPAANSPVLDGAIGGTGTFDSVLVANRGEIARRVFHACREMGLGTVAVFSDPDAESPHAREADTAVRLPGSSPTQTYLRADLIVAAALRAGAGAVHPGYGFLAESAAFARAVQAAGLVWIGPSPEAIELMGSKIEAKRLMAAAGVPVLAELDPDLVSANEFPLLIKASAGGGGRGMRIVGEETALRRQLAAARDEARSAFGDPAVFCEPFLAAGRHLEIQVMADHYGAIWALGERECSIQRRHQKVLEEAPSPFADRMPGLRERLVEAAQAATRAVRYTGAGTVEFIVDSDGRFYFLEMNTRLQVEHPVTECTTGLDLVRLQLEVASGRQLIGPPPPVSGHAIEVRLYAEDPAQDWQPQTGTLRRFEIEPTTRFADPGRPGLRLDSAVETGASVGPHYDPMLAKVICSASDRATAARLLARSLAEARIHGVATNRDLLVRVLRHPAFLAGDTDTSFLQRPELFRPLADEGAERLCVLAAALADAAVNRAHSGTLPGVPGGWRNVMSQPQRADYRAGERQHQIEYRYGRTGVQPIGFPDVSVVASAPQEVVLEVAGVRHRFAVARDGREVWVDSALGSVALIRAERFADPAAVVAAGSLLAPVPGVVIRLGADTGERIERSQPLLWIEAMKMEHPVLAPVSGQLAELRVSVGDQVSVGDVLAQVTEGGALSTSSGPS